MNGYKVTVTSFFEHPTGDKFFAGATGILSESRKMLVFNNNEFVQVHGGKPVYGPVNLENPKECWYGHLEIGQRIHMCTGYGETFEL